MKKIVSLLSLCWILVALLPAQAQEGTQPITRASAPFLQLIDTPFRTTDLVFQASIAPNWTSMAVWGLLSLNLEVWDMQTGQLRYAFPMPNILLSNVVMRRDGQIFATSGESRFQIWDTRTGLISAAIVAPDVQYIAFNTDVSLYAAAHQESVEVWDLDAGFVSTLENSAGMVFLDFSPSDTLIAGSTSTGQIRVWDTATGEMLFHAAATGERFAWAPDEAALVTGCAPSALCLWDVSSGELIWKTPDTSRFGIVSVLEFNSDGTLLASSASGTTGVIVDVLTGIVLAQLDQGVASSALEFSWSSDGTRLASISRDGYLRLWGVPADIEVPDLTLNDGGRAVVNDTPSVRAASLIADNTSGTEGWAVESADGIQTLIPLADN